MQPQMGMGSGMGNGMGSGMGGAMSGTVGGPIGGPMLGGMGNVFVPSPPPSPPSASLPPSRASSSRPPSPPLSSCPPSPPPSPPPPPLPASCGHSCGAMGDTQHGVVGLNGGPGGDLGPAMSGSMTNGVGGTVGNMAGVDTLGNAAGAPPGGQQAPMVDASVQQQQLALSGLGSGTGLVNGLPPPVRAGMVRVLHHLCV